MAIKINWKDAEKKVIPEGTEIAFTVRKADYKAQSGQSGQPAVNYQLTVNEPTEFAGQIVFKLFSLQPQALWAYKQFLVRSGAPESLFDDDEVDIQKVIDASIGLRGRAVVVVREYKDKDGVDQQTNNIKEFLSSESFSL